MREQNEQERSRRLEALLRSLEAENRMDAARSAELIEALAPIAAADVPDRIREELDARFALDALSTHATSSPLPATRAPFIRA